MDAPELKFRVVWAEAKVQFFSESWNWNWEKIIWTSPASLKCSKSKKKKRSSKDGEKRPVVLTRPETEMV